MKAVAQDVADIRSGAATVLESSGRLPRAFPIGAVADLCITRVPGTTANFQPARRHQRTNGRLRFQVLESSLLSPLAFRAAEHWGGQRQLKKALRILLWLVLANLPRQAWAIDSCSQCVLGIWDDPALSSNLGEIVAGQPKDIYVGIKFAEGFNETIGISFSVAGLSPFLVLGVEPIVPTILVGYINAPTDTSMSSSGLGGLSVAWPGCLVGNQALLRVTLRTSSNVTNGLLQVKRKYPPTHPDARTPVFYQCNDPQYTATRVKGGYYILNWNGDPSVRVDGATWFTVKQLYR